MIILQFIAKSNRSLLRPVASSNLTMHLMKVAGKRTCMPWKWKSQGR